MPGWSLNSSSPSWTPASAPSDADTIDVVSVNGHVQTIDPATGRPDHPCLVTVTTDRATFNELDLRHPKLDPKACLRKLGAEISPHPHDLEHIPSDR